LLHAGLQSSKDEISEISWFLRPQDALFSPPAARPLACSLHLPQRNACRKWLESSEASAAPPDFYPNAVGGALLKPAC
jgi:hypothetical protein